MKKSIPFLVLLVLLTTGCGDYQRVVPLGGTDYLPLKEDLTLRYRLTYYGDVEEYSMRLRYLGGKDYKVYKAYYKGDAQGGLEFSSHNQQVAAITQYSLTSLGSRYERGDFQQVWIDESLQPGDFWQDADTGTQTVFVGYEDITVPAGTFTDCYKTATEALPELVDSINARFDRKEMDSEMFNQELENAKIVVSRWFARDVGLVKEQFGTSEYVRELLAVENEGWYTKPSTSSTEEQ
ncbi:hypothetical protein KKC97_05555 [bacterium]|nr:hypothetical protein [bacterium]MBU1637115.1 hypothetical protein [bacterium]MBU1920130.1 hypothetical protein [bacterium]